MSTSNAIATLHKKGLNHGNYKHNAPYSFQKPWTLPSIPDKPVLQKFLGTWPLKSTRQDNIQISQHAEKFKLKNIRNVNNSAIPNIKSKI